MFKISNYCIKFPIIICCIAVFFSSCEKNVQIDILYDGDKIVLNSLILKDSFIYARVTKSLKLGADVYDPNTFALPAGAKVRLYENDIFKQLMLIKNVNGKPYFVSSIKAKEGMKYTLTASATGMQEATGSDKVPSGPNCQGISFKKVGDVYKVQFKLKDNGAENNYYRLRVFDVFTVNNVLDIKENARYFSIDQLDLNGVGIFGAMEAGQNYFTDALFNGKEITFTLSLDAAYYVQDPANYTHVAVRLENLTPNTYNYLTTVSKQQEPGGLNPFTEPIIDYSNIKNGYGIVGGMAENQMLIKKQ